MKRVLTIFAQFVLFLCVNAVGGIFYHPFHIQTSLSGMSTAPRSFVWDGIVLMLLAYGILIAIAAMRKRLALSLPATSLALALAALAGYLLKFGFITQNW